MKNTAIILVASAAVVSAGVIANPDGTYTCEKADAAYCAGDSLGTDIIIRCYGTVGQPGRCSNNLAGQPPIGNTPALCYQTDEEVGDAACEKNCVVYGGSGNGNGTWTLPAELCTPTWTASSSVVPSSTAPPSSSYPVSSPSSTEPPHSSKPPHSTKTDCPSDTTFVSSTVYPSSATSSPYVPPPVYPTNGTIPTVEPTLPPTEPTAVPSSPVEPPPVPAAAVHNSAAGGALAVVALVAAYIL